MWRSLIVASLVLLSACASSDVHDEISAEALSSDLTPFQREILRDDIVTDTEMERTFLGFVDCVEAGGLRVVDPEFLGASGWSYDVGFINETDLGLHEACEKEYLGVIGRPYMAAHQRT